MTAAIRAHKARCGISRTERIQLAMGLPRWSSAGPPGRSRGAASAIADASSSRRACLSSTVPPRRERVVWSGTRSSRAIKRTREPTKPSVCPAGRPEGGAFQESTASASNQNVMSPPSLQRLLVRRPVPHPVLGLVLRRHLALRACGHRRRLRGPCLGSHHGARRTGRSRWPSHAPTPCNDAPRYAPRKD